MAKRSRSTAVKAAFTFEGHTAPVLNAAVAACVAADTATGKLTHAMVAAYVGVICADMTITIKAASALIGDRVPASKESGNPAATRKAWVASYFKDSANLAKVRAMIPRPEGLTEGQFLDACNSAADKLDVRAAYQAKLASNKASKDQAENAKGETSAHAPAPVEPPPPTALDYQTRASQALADLVRLRDLPHIKAVKAEAKRADIRAAAADALATLYAQLGEIMVQGEAARKAA